AGLQVAEGADQARRGIMITETVVVEVDLASPGRCPIVGVLDTDARGPVTLADHNASPGAAGCAARSSHTVCYHMHRPTGCHSRSNVSDLASPHGPQVRTPIAARGSVCSHLRVPTPPNCPPGPSVGSDRVEVQSFPLGAGVGVAVVTVGIVRLDIAQPERA